MADMPKCDAERLPEAFQDVADLEDWLTKPTARLVDDLHELDGDIMILGVSGKMGPTLARLAKRAAPKKHIIGVARFSEPDVRKRLEAHGISTVACDFLDRSELERLPDAPNVVLMAGLSLRKFGPTGVEPLTWAMNVHAPALVSERFAGSRLVSFSTGCVYPYVPIYSGGATELTPPGPPASEYANSCVGRERIIQHFSKVNHTPGRIIRLNYAIDMRYGVLHDIARKVITGAPIDLTVGHVNVIWQGDAATMALRSFLHCAIPASPVNISGPETISVRAISGIFGKLFNRPPVLVGIEAETAWLVNTSLAMQTFGYPTVSLGHLVAWTANWVARNLPSLNKETQYDARA